MVEGPCCATPAAARLGTTRPSDVSAITGSFLLCIRYCPLSNPPKSKIWSFTNSLGTWSAFHASPEIHLTLSAGKFPHQKRRNGSITARRGYPRRHRFPSLASNLASRQDGHDDPHGAALAQRPRRIAAGASGGQDVVNQDTGGVPQSRSRPRPEGSSHVVPPCRRRRLRLLGRVADAPQPARATLQPQAPCQFLGKHFALVVA